MTEGSNAQQPSPFAHWMFREIYEQPGTLRATLAQLVEGGRFRGDTCAPIRKWLQQTQNEIVIAASGSSRHAGQVAELWIEDESGLAVDVEYASEYVYRSERSLKRASILVISQSGETADTLAALRKAKSMGAPTIAITNVPASAMAAEAAVSFPTCAGRERAVPATKSFTAQLLNCYLLALLAGEQRGQLNEAEVQQKLSRLERLPEQIERQLPRWEREVEAAVEGLSTKKSFLFVGRDVHYPIAREAALKLKESSYLSAQGYPSGELKHGPSALLSEDTPLVMLATVDRENPESVIRYERVVQLMRDMREQGAIILAVANEGDGEVAKVAQFVVTVQAASEPAMVMTEIIPLQLFAYLTAVRNGIDVDRPRNLTKAVLTE